jgi:phenylacetate-CoA ligase
MNSLVKKLKSLRLGDVAIRRNPAFYASGREQLESLLSADLAARREWTRARLEKVLWAARRSPYGESLDTPGSLSDWPLLDKTRVRNEPRAFASGSGLLGVKASTGGTTGAPLRLVRSFRSVVFEQVCIDEMVRKLGVDPLNASTAVLRGDDIKDPSDFSPPYWKHAAGGRKMILSSNHLNAATVQHFATALEEFEPDILYAYPTTLESLCVQLQRKHMQLPIKRVLTSSEVLRPEVWRLAQDVLGCRIVDYYGQAERVAFCYAESAAEYRFLPGYAHVEFHPVERTSEEVVYEIVGTSLWNLAMPFVRYRTGDLVRIPARWGKAELEELALGFRTCAGVLGRDSDILISPDGVRLTGIDHFQRNVDHLVRIQVIQETPELVRVLVLPAAGYSPHDEAQLKANIGAKLPATMRVVIEVVEQLERTVLGKTPFVLHRQPVRDALRSAARVSA